MAYARGRRRFVARPPRLLSWARSTPTTQTTVPAANKIFAASATLSNPGIDETVRRTRGGIWIQSDQSAAIENQLGALGAIVITDQAASVGITAIPDPITDASDDGWFIWLPFNQSGDLSAGRTGYWHEFDSKAMRKVSEGFQVAFVVANGSASNGLQFSLSFSLLASRQ